MTSRTRPPKVNTASIRASIAALLEGNQLELAQTTLHHAMRAIRDFHGWLELRTTIELIPEFTRLHSPIWAAMYARTLRGTRQTERLLEFTARALEHHHGVQATEIKLERGWALLAEDRYLEARELIVPLLPDLTGWQLGFAHRCLGELDCELGLPWQHWFQQAQTHLSGRLLGLMRIDQGNCYEHTEDQIGARDCWLKALGLLRDDLYHQAWLRYNLGASLLRENDPDAERHFLEAERLSRSPRAKSFRTWALIGLGGARRIQGDWKRAEDHYRQAVSNANNQDEQQQAHWGLGHTLRLLHRYEEALEHLHQAAQASVEQVSLHANARPTMTHVTWVNISLAALWLQRDDQQRSQHYLEHSGTFSGNEIYRYSIVQAELARRNSNPNQALEHLRNLPSDALTVREELYCFPELYALATACNLALPTPLTLSVAPRVNVQAIGLLRVQVNDQSIAIVPNSRIGELLVLLLEHQGQQTIDVLIETLWPDTPGDKKSRERKRKTLWNLVAKLRTALGWNGSVIALNGAYQLDPEADWLYDVQDARANQRPVTVFLEGVYSDWARDVADAFLVANSPRVVN
jgi:tetratricopeptide (TPR) repeat protein